MYLFLVFFLYIVIFEFHCRIWVNIFSFDSIRDWFSQLNLAINMFSLSWWNLRRFWIMPPLSHGICNNPVVCNGWNHFSKAGIGRILFGKHQTSFKGKILIIFWFESNCHRWFVIVTNQTLFTFLGSQFSLLCLWFKIGSAFELFSSLKKCSSF